MIFNVKEVNKELKPEKPEIVYKPWVEVVPKIDGVIYLRLINDSDDIFSKITLVCVDYLGKYIYGGNLLRINNDNHITSFRGISDKFGIKLTDEKTIQVSESF